VRHENQHVRLWGQPLCQRLAKLKGPRRQDVGVYVFSWPDVTSGKSEHGSSVAFDCRALHDHLLQQRAVGPRLFEHVFSST
jgi:hypothetical protein